MTREEIKMFLVGGDYIKIARICAARGTVTTPNYVGEVISGKRNSRIKTGKLIMEVAEEMANEQKKLIDQATQAKQNKLLSA